ncbi:hypothetical protein SOVF_138310, partial [Spinacia oleracea]
VPTEKIAPGESCVWHTKCKSLMMGFVRIERLRRG